VTAQGLRKHRLICRHAPCWWASLMTRQMTDWSNDCHLTWRRNITEDAPWWALRVVSSPTDKHFAKRYCHSRKRQKEVRRDHITHGNKTGG
jgi:hypothetical protein